MKEKKLLDVQTKLGKYLFALYQYQTSHGLIPIFVLDTVDFHALSKVKKDFEKEKCIVLSKDDVLNGHDVFPLRFLHMINHSSLILGTDILKSITIKKADLLKTVELELRTKMVQLREDYLSGSFDVFVKNILSFMEVIREGVEYIDPSLKSDGKIFSDLYDEKAKKQDPLHVVSHINLYLDDLCAKIDARHVA
ncbi:MAG: hypothetical protein CO170_01585 [candidate division SR1 bacterium CG_4_9_14_3_um_filter_40_9]|nr:MAG: hypothetical protein CO170_01585 [candidate division SR1 bacterium CG_4_9_14_3_um_filter_40_9]